MASVKLRLSLRLRLLLTPTFCMEDIDMDMVLDTEHTMASVKLRLSLRLRLLLTPTFCIEDMDMDIMVLATMVLATGFMESVPLMLSPKLMPTPIFSMDMDMDMDTLDMLDITDTHMVDILTS